MEEIDYITLYLLSPKFTAYPLGTFLLLLLALIRLLPIVALVPFLGARNINKPSKVGLAVVITLVMFPSLITISTMELHCDFVFLCLMIKEFFIGFSIATIASLPFYMVEISGTIIDHQRGASSLMLNDPILTNQNAPTGILFNYVGIVLFFWINGPFIFFDALASSFTNLPPDQFCSSILFETKSPFCVQVMSLFNLEMKTAIKLASPALCIMFMTDVFLGIVNRLAPQVMITFLGMSLKSLLGLLMVWLGWFIVIKEIAKEYLNWMELVKQVAYWIGLFQ